MSLDQEKIVSLDKLARFKQKIQSSLSNIDSLMERLIDNASYNILPNKAVNTDEGTSGSSGGSIEWTVDDFGIVRMVKNTYTSTTKYLTINDSFVLYAGDYTLYGCAKGGGDSSNSKYWIEVSTGTTTYKDYGHGINFTVDSDTVVTVKIGISVEAKNLFFYPMIVRGTKDIYPYTEPTFGKDPYPGYFYIGDAVVDNKAVHIYANDDGDPIYVDLEELDSNPSNQQSIIKENNVWTPYYPTNVELESMLKNMEVATATTTSTGVVKPDGTTITIDQDGTIHGASQVDTATSSSLGVVKPDNDTITIDANGVISATETPVATTSAVGTVKPDGTTITIDNDGTIHGASQVDIATASTVGVVKPDGSTTSVNASGALSVNTATSSAKGIVKPDNDSITIDANGEISCNLTSYTTSELDTMWANAGNNS